MRKPHILLQIIWFGKPMKRIIRGFFCALFCGGLVCASVFCIIVKAGDTSIPVYTQDILLKSPRQESVQGNIAAYEVEDVQDSGANEEFSKQLYATSAVLMDADSGRVLYGKNEDAPMAMASTTKIMTCIVILEEGNLEDTLQVSSYAASMPKVKLYIKKGETYLVKDLLYSLMLESHNDSAVALAEYVGSRYLPDEMKGKEISEHTVEESKQAVAAFAALMNKKAKELGCEDTYFITPNGLDATETITIEEKGETQTIQKEHHTTAKELAKIMAYCIAESEKKEDFLNITRTESYSFSGNGRNYSCNNHNAFLSMMDGALSGKTGFTNKAGYCYVGALRRNERTFVVALLACGWPNHKMYKWSDTRALMQYGTDHFFYRDFMSEEIAFDERRLKPLLVENGRTEILGGTAYAEIGIMERMQEGEGLLQNENTGRIAEEKTENDKMMEYEKNLHGILMRPDEEVRVECRMRKTLEAPVRKGEVIGNIYYLVDGNVYRQETIIAEQNMKR